MPEHDKLFKGLVHHLTKGCEGCPYDKKNPGCWTDLARDALDFIEISVSRDLFLEVLKKYNDSENALIYEYCCDFEKAHGRLDSEVDEYLLKAGIPKIKINEYRQRNGIERTRDSLL